MARRIAVEIVGDSSSLEKAFQRSSRSAQNFNRDIGKTSKRKPFAGLGKAAGLAGGLLGIGGLASAAKAAFTEMGDAQKVSAQTTAALKSTGGAANVTAKQMDDLATSLMNKTGTDDEAIKSSENLLLTFTKVRNETGKGNDVFNQATSTILDMSTALGQDTKNSAIQLGKALSDPIKGITALRRVGVTFTDGQKKQIAAMVKTGDTMGAQKLILAELNKEFGGSAEAAGKTLPGQLNILKESALNLGGSIATLLTPQITKVIESMTRWLSNSENQKTVLDTVKTAVGVLSTALGILKTAFELLSGIVGGNKNAIIALVAAYATFKAVQIAGRVATLADSFLTLARRERGARTAAVGLRGSLIGKAGLVGAAGLASYELTKMALNATGLDKKLFALGRTAYDTAAKLGLVHDPMAQFAGTKAPSQRAAGKIRRQAAKLEAGGLTPQQAVNVIAPRHPGFARRDIEVLAGALGKAKPQVNIKPGQRPRTPGLTPRQAGNVFNRQPTRDPDILTRPISAGITISGGLHLHGVQNPRQLEDQLLKRHKQRPRRRH